MSHVSETYSSISFDVTTLGSPVVVKTPYFPNWQATGASGPYEASPNVMVVVPTSHHVTLTYGTTTVDWIGKAASVAGLVGLGTLVFRSPVDVGPDPTAATPDPVLPVSAPGTAGDPTSTATFDPFYGTEDGATRTDERDDDGEGDDDGPGDDDGHEKQDSQASAANDTGGRPVESVTP